MGAAGLRACLDRAERTFDVAGLSLIPGTRRDGRRAALVFPHTCLETSGELAAAAALAVVRSGVEEVLALGVLHGGREEDAALVGRARAAAEGREDGDPEAWARLRRVHGPGIAGDGDHWREEFSLDGFVALLETTAAQVSRRRPPRVVCRYPFLVGTHPETLPGVEELHALLARGAVLVATADPVHHGRDYGVPPGACRPQEDTAATEAFARACVLDGFHRLARADYAGFLDHAVETRSDFRDPGPVFAHLLGASAGTPLEVGLHGLRLTDYAAALGALSPTWAAGALATFGSSVAPSATAGSPANQSR